MAERNPRRTPRPARPAPASQEPADRTIMPLKPPSIPNQLPKNAKPSANPQKPEPNHVLRCTAHYTVKLWLRNQSIFLIISS
jgi:hypothetical protein